MVRTILVFVLVTLILEISENSELRTATTD